MKNAVAQIIRPVGIALMLATLMTSLIVRVPLSRAAENPMGRAGASPVKNLWPLDNAGSAVADSAQPSQTDASLRAQVSENYGRLPLSFELNQGQTHPQVKFISRGLGYKLFLTATESVLTFNRSEMRNDRSHFAPTRAKEYATSGDYKHLAPDGANQPSFLTLNSR